MSNALAIAAVTAVLKNLLDNAVIDTSLVTAVNDTVTVTTRAPSDVENDAKGKVQLNLFLYHVEPNPGWRNAGLPSTDQRGARLTNPPLALDLFYLLTAYGNKDFDAEVILGYAMQLFHETPVLRRDQIRTTFGGNGGGTPPVSGGVLPTSYQALSASELAEQVESIKITPHTMTTEEASKLWTAFQARYHPSVAYHVSVVLIEAKRPVRSGLPVRERRFHVLPFNAPVIESVSPQIIKTGETFTLRGRNLKREKVKVSFGNFCMDPEPARIFQDKIEVSIPPDLMAGINTVQVVHDLDFGTPKEPHGGFRSNIMAFMLAPKLMTPPPGTASRGSTLQLSLDPKVGPLQKASLLLGDISITIPSRPSAEPASSSLEFPIPGDFPTGDFLLRVRVDAGESQLDVDEDPTSPTANQYIGPRVTVT